MTVIKKDKLQTYKDKNVRKLKFVFKSVDRISKSMVFFVDNWK